MLRQFSLTIAIQLTLAPNMGDLVHFIARASRDGRSNLSEFIELARDELTAFGEGGAWESDTWRDGQAVVFATKTQKLTPYVFTPMAEPFKQFAKAYLRYHYSHNPVKSAAYMMAGLRCVEAALLAARGKADVLLLNGAVMNLAAEKCREFYRSDGSRCNAGRHIKSIFDFVREQRFVPGLPAWKSPFKKPMSLAETLAESGRAHRESRLPPNDSMLALAELFSTADDAESRFYSSIMILLMATPSRIGEVLALPTDCIQWEPDDAGTMQMCLRWRASKGKGDMKKWILPVMREVVQEAVDRLIEIGAPARGAARFAFDHPGMFFPHGSCIVDPAVTPDALLSEDEAYAALELKARSRGMGAGSFDLASLRADKRVALLAGRREISYRDLAEYVLKTYGGKHWPSIDEGGSVKVWDALCLHRCNEFHRVFKARQFSWRLPTATEVNSRLTPEHGRSLFEAKGFRRRDGSGVRLTTHQPRHWLSTMSERAGMDDYTLAQWAGRAKVADNRHYDHRSPEERLESAKAVMAFERPSLLERFKERRPVTYAELGVRRLGAAKATLYGMCVHDYAMTPCERQRECMTCKEHVCIKGDHVTLGRIRLLEAQTAALLEHARSAQEDGDFGADRWVDNHKWKLAHVRSMRMALENPATQDGAVLKIPEGHDPSAVRRALMDLGLIDLPTEEVVGSKVIALELM